MSRALVTGATGFVGSRLTERLVEQGWDVLALVRPTSALDRLDSVRDRIDVLVDPGDVESLAAALDRVQLDACFHLAAHFVGQHSPADVVPLVEANVKLPARLAEALSGRPDLAFVNTGTGWMHVGGEDYSPAALYAAMKQAAKDILRFYAESGAFRVCTVSLYDTYGPNDPRPKLLNALRRAQRDGTALQMSSGHQLIDLVHVDDVADAFIAAARADAEKFPEYAVSSGQAMSLRDLVALIERVTGRPVPVEWGVRPNRPREMDAFWDFAPAVPGWHPRVPLEDGLRQVWS